MSAVLNLITQQKGRVYLSVTRTGQCVLSAGSAGHYTGITQALQRHYTVPGSAGATRHPHPALLRPLTTDLGSQFNVSVSTL